MHYDPQKPLSLAVDASPKGLGAVISHETKEGERPIAYALRSLTPAERNYSQLEREGLAIIFGLQKFHQYLYGRRFTLITDNKPLGLIFGPKKGIPVLAATRIQRWAIKMAAYNYDIKIRSSSQNSNADALSRLPLPTSVQPEETVNWTAEASAVNRAQINQLPVTAKAIARETQHDPMLSKVRHFVITAWPAVDDMSQELHPFYHRRNELTVEENCLLWGIRTIIPKKFQDHLLQDLHENHPGMVNVLP